MTLAGDFGAPEQQKNSTLAVVLSLILPGAGQIYNGEVGKGVTLIVVSVICIAASALVFPFLILIGIWVWGMTDANTVAKNYNENLAQLKRKATEEESKLIRAKDFFEQVEKFWKLQEAGLLSASEFADRKKVLIRTLAEKKRTESPDDFLAELIPLVKSGKIDDAEVTQIKALLW